MGGVGAPLTPARLGQTEGREERGAEPREASGDDRHAVERAVPIHREEDDAEDPGHRHDAEGAHERGEARPRGEALGEEPEHRPDAEREDRHRGAREHRGRRVRSSADGRPARDVAERVPPEVVAHRTGVEVVAAAVVAGRGREDDHRRERADDGDARGDVGGERSGLGHARHGRRQGSERGRRPSALDSSDDARGRPLVDGNELRGARGPTRAGPFAGSAQVARSTSARCAAIASLT